jgi:hypothetical protein
MSTFLEFTLWKFGILGVIAFVYGFIRRRRELRQQSKDSEAVD